MLIFKHIIRLVASFSFYVSVFSQPVNNNLRSIIVAQGDSIVKTFISYKSPQKVPVSNAIFYWYFNENIHQNKGSFSGKPLQGKYEVFNNTSNLITQGKFDGGLMTGIWNRWYPNGNKKESSYYKKGLKSGKSILYNPEGKIIAQLSYKYNRLEGKSLFYLGDTMIVRSYKNGQEVVIKKKEAHIKTYRKPKNPNEIMSKDSTLDKKHFWNRWIEKIRNPKPVKSDKLNKN